MAIDPRLTTYIIEARNHFINHTRTKDFLDMEEKRIFVKGSVVPKIINEMVKANIKFDVIVNIVRDVVVELKYDGIETYIKVGE